jgi:hypothetical protein
MAIRDLPTPAFPEIIICKNSKVNLNIFALSAISYDLLEKYPSIAKDHLGVEVDTGQIVPLNKYS